MEEWGLLIAAAFVGLLIGQVIRRLRGKKKDPYAAYTVPTPRQRLSKKERRKKTQGKAT
jgi:hypothetical protein